MVYTLTVSESEPTPGEFPVRRELELIYADVDTVGHVNNVAIARYFQEARVLLFEALRATLPRDADLLVHLRRLEIDYLGQVLYPGRIEIAIRVDGLGTTSIRTASALYQGGSCAARAVSVDVAVDPTTRRPTALTGEQRAALAALGRPT